METKMQNNSTNPFTIIQNYFLIHWVNIIGLGPAMLYIQLASYCHKGKDTAWPSIKALNKRMGTTTKTLIKYRDTLVEYGLIKKIVKQKSTSGGYDHNLYQIILLDKEKIHLPPVEKLPEENEKVISDIAESPCSNHHNSNNNPEKVVNADKKSLKKERIKEELMRINLDKKSIDKLILNYPLEDIEEKLELIEIKKDIINPAGWFVAALKANYTNPESFKEENDEVEEEEQKNKIVKPDKLALKEKQEEEKKKLFLEEELKWTRYNLEQTDEI